MLPKKNRFPLKKGFFQFKKEARLYQFPFFGLLVKSQKEFASQFAFIISKKIDKRAVTRNRIKRLLAESVASFPYKPGFGVVFLAKKSLLAKNFSQIREAVKSCFREIGLL